MTQTIWIVRHGNREDFLDRTWSQTAERPHDPGLSPDGEEQARELGLSLRDQSVDRIYASPFLRTIQTASHIADALDLPVRLEPGLGEVLPYLAEPPLLLPEQERHQRFQRIDAAYEFLFTPSYPEPEEAAHRRAAETVQRIADQHPDENILFVTHASPVVGIVRRLTSTQDRIRVPLCCLFTLARTEDGWQLVQEADVTHLSDQAASLRYVHVG